MQPVVMVTGASRGIGAATALAFGRAGWRVAITARTATEGERHDQQLLRPDGRTLAGSLDACLHALQAAGVPALAQRMDLMDAESLKAAVEAVLAHFGRVDLLINNAVYQAPEMNARLAQLQPDALQRTLWGNVVAPMLLVQHLLPAFVAQGSAQVINIASGAGQADSPLPPDEGGWSFAYGASKAALARLSGFINLEHGRQGLRAFTVNPGLVSTEAVTATLGDGGLLEQRYGAMAPGRIAAGLLWLATDERAAPLARRASMIELQALIREHGIGA
jgi:NAD(P)-dependent dehydrogenase (short-subunit alcohol dehydrogenase family)